MAERLSESEKKERLAGLLKEFDTAMLVTRTVSGELRSRPLAITENRGDGMLYFATAVESEKVHELVADSHVNVTLQAKHRFISISGHARISHERALIDALWSDSWKIWFPKGKSDPSLRLIVVEPSEAQYWDAEGWEGLKYLFEAAKAVVTGVRPDSDSDERHTAKVRL
jgi:general stress protein 26